MPLSEITVAPNPFTDRIHVSGLSGELRYSFTDLMGRMALKGTAKGGTIMLPDAMLPGLYFLTLRADERTRTVKVLRER